MKRLRNWKGFTLVELLVVIAIIALLISILLPSLSRARELSKRLVCGSNVKGIGTAAKIYANDNQEQWMIPGHKGNAYGTTPIQYTSAGVTGTLGGTTFHGNNALIRQQQSTKETLAGSGGSTQLSTTRAFWMLVRSGDTTVQQYVCPSSGAAPDPTENIDLYYEFTSLNNVSYGYQVPYGPRDTRAREGMDNRQAVVADRGPNWGKNTDPGFSTAGQTGGPITLDDSPRQWRTFNSPNHGGTANGEGQNVLFADGHASFLRIPAVGVDNDNIYTVVENNWAILNPVLGNLIHGAAPEETIAINYYPGQGAFGAPSSLSTFSSTDTLIYP